MSADKSKMMKGKKQKHSAVPVISVKKENKGTVKNVTKLKVIFVL